jgi:hypothetical protein
VFGSVEKEETTTGSSLNTSFNASLASGSDVYYWTTTGGYVCNKHFSADLGVPLLFVHQLRLLALPLQTPGWETFLVGCNSLIRVRC